MQQVGGLSSLGSGQVCAWEHQRDVPAHFGLGTTSRLVDQALPVAVQEVGPRSGDFLCGIGAAHGNDRVLVQHPLEELVEQARIIDDRLGNGIGAADGTPVTAGEFTVDVHGKEVLGSGRFFLNLVRYSTYTEGT